jgi:hypothetical protein
VTSKIECAVVVRTGTRIIAPNTIFLQNRGLLWRAPFLGFWETGAFARSGDAVYFSNLSRRGTIPTRASAAVAGWTSGTGPRHALGMVPAMLFCNIFFP